MWTLRCEYCSLLHLTLISAEHNQQLTDILYTVDLLFNKKSQKHNCKPDTLPLDNVSLSRNMFTTFNYTLDCAAASSAENSLVVSHTMFMILVSG